MNPIDSMTFLHLVSHGWHNLTATWWIKHRTWHTGKLKQYLSCYPYNDLYGKWLTDKNVASKVYHDLSAFFPKRCFLLYQRNNSLAIIDLRKGQKSTAKLQDIIDLLHDTGGLYVTKTRGLCGTMLSYRDQTYCMNDAVVAVSDILQFLSQPDGVLLIEELCYQNPTVSIMRCICTRNADGILQITQAYYVTVSTTDCNSKEYYRHRNEINDNYNTIYHVLDQTDNDRYEPLSEETLEKLAPLVARLGDITPAINLCGIDVYQDTAGFKIMDTTDLPYYPVKDGFTAATLENLSFYSKTAYQSVFSILHGKCSTFMWMVLSKCFGKLPMRPLVFRDYVQMLKKDFFSRNGLTIKQKRRAYRWGFLSYRLHQYGIDDSNRKQFISDRQYCSLKHINIKYRTILEDKLTIKYILHEFEQFLPEYYYLVMNSTVNQGIVPLMDCPSCYRNGADGFISLLKEKGILACKPQRGSHGDGFVRLDYKNNSFYMNGDEVSADAIVRKILDPAKQYLITEYICLHPVLKRIFPDSVNTMRVIVFKNALGEYEIGNAYLRFGNSRTHGVDNMGAGGLFAAIDVTSGRFGDGKQILNNIISPCPVHPDTNIPIEGQLPHWEQTKQDILSLCECLPELEYMGLDIAITENGMKIPEINRSPDYPAIERLSDRTMQYLLATFEERRNGH